MEMKKKGLYLLIVAAFLVLAIVFQKNDFVETFNVNSQSKEEIKDELIIALFINSIDKNVQKFYSQYLSSEVTVYNYETEILDIKKEEGQIKIRFGIAPQIGAHNPVGYDEMVYFIQPSGSVELESYEHIKSEPISEHYQKFVIAPLP